MATIVQSRQGTGPGAGGKHEDESVRERTNTPAAAVDRRPRLGRRPLMSEEILVDEIRRLGAREGGLFRVHRRRGWLYARARRQFGSWAAALGAAGFEHARVLESARQRSLENRRDRRSRRPAV